MAANRFDQIIDEFEPQFRRAFLTSIYAIRDAAHFEQIVRMLENGDVAGAVRAVGIDPSQVQYLDEVRTAAFRAAGDYTAGLIPITIDEDGFRTIFQFGVRNPEAEEWLRREAASDVVEILGDQQIAIRNFLEAGLQAGDNPRTTALDLIGRVSKETGRREGGIIGLTSTQEEWVRNYEAELRGDDPAAALERALRDKRFDRTVLNAIANDEPIPDSAISSMVTNYKNRALKYRADAIARTETIAAVHTAQDQALAQALALGAVAEDEILLTWNTAGDDRVRASHEELDGQTIVRGEVFVTEHGELAYPGDPDGEPEDIINCRCYLEVSVDFLKRAL